MAKKLSRDYFAISAKNVHLDTQNPRHDYKETEREIILSLCDEKLVALSRDIASIGSLSPLDIIGVIPSPNAKGHYIALEGNRRTCALLLLADPSRAPDEYKERFEKISRTSNIPTELHAYIFIDREAAQPWLDRRHMGEQGGVGTARWDAKAQARRASKDKAEKSTAHANVLALSVIDRLLSTKRITLEQKEKLKITTLARYLNNGHRQKIIGISGLSIDGKILYSHDPDVVDGILQKLCIDSIPIGDNKKAIVHSRASAEDCADYLIEIASGKITPDTKIDASSYAQAGQPENTTSNSESAPIEATQEDKPLAVGIWTESGLNNIDNISVPISIEIPEHKTIFSDATDAVEGEGNLVINSDAKPEFTNSGNATTSIRSVRDKSNRNRILDTTFIIPVPDKVLVRLRKEMLALDTDEHEFAANYLLRALIERTIVLYYRKKIPTRKYDNDLQLTQRCAQDAQQENASRNIQDILNQAATNGSIAHSLYTLGTGIHGGTFPTKRQLNAVFDTWEPALKYMLEITSITIPDIRARPA